jgi:hypothetical protein
MAQVRRVLQIAQQLKPEEQRAFSQVRFSSPSCSAKRPLSSPSSPLSVLQAIASYDRTLSMRLYVHCTLFKYELRTITS